MGSERSQSNPPGRLITLGYVLGVMAQLAERHLAKVKVAGSRPAYSSSPPARGYSRDASKPE